MTSDDAPAPRRLTTTLACWAPLLALIAAPLLTFARVWLGGSDAAYLAGDTNGEYWPDLVFFFRALSGGDLPLWNQGDRGGYPFCCDPQIGVLYPVNWLLVGLASVVGSLPFWILQLKVFIHLGLAGAAMFVFLRGRGLGRTPATLGGLAYQHGPFLIGNAHFSLLWPVAWIPLLLWASDRLLEPGRRPTLGAAVTFAVFAWMVATAGSPPAAFYGLLVWLVWVLTRLVALVRAEGLRPSLRARGPMLALAGGLGLLLGLPSLLGMLALTRHSVLSERSTDYVLGGGLRPDELLGLVVRSGNRLYIYAGAVVVLLALLGLLAGRRRAGTVTYAGLTAFGLLLALAAHAHVLPLLARFLPGFEYFRLPFRYVYLANFGLAALAATGLAEVLEAGPLARRASWLVARVLAVIAAVVLWATLSSVGERTQILRDAWFGVLACALALALALPAVRAGGPRLRAVLGALIVLVAYVDLATLAQRSGLTRDGPFDPTPAIPAAPLDALLAEATDYRVYDEFGLCWRAGSRTALRDFRGYMDPLRLRRYDAIIQALHTRPWLVERFNVKHVLHHPHPYHGASHHHVRAPRRIPGARDIGHGIWQLAAPDAYATWVAGARVVATDAEVLRLLDAPDARRQALVAESDLTPDQRAVVADLAPGGEVPARAAEILDLGPGRVRVTVDAPAAGLVVVNEAWFPGWRATVDGQPAPVLRANSLVQAVPVPAGRHEVSLAFRPAYFLWPAGLGLGALAALLAALALGRVRRGRMNG